MGAPPSDAPQRPQNFTPKGCSKPHREQVTVLFCPEAGPGGGTIPAAPAFSSELISEVTGLKLVLPQRPQNFAVAAKREPHFVQATTPGVLEGAPETLPKLPPLEGESPLEAADLN